MQDLIIPGLVITLILARGGYAHYAKIKKEAKRQEALQHAVSELGHDYEPSLSPPDFELFQRFGLAGKGRNKVSSNATVVDSGTLRLVIFDHSYTNGTGKNTAVFTRQVVMATGDDLKAPDFLLESDPRRFASAISKLLGLKGNNLKFKDDPEFSKRFSLTGPDEVAVKNFLTPQRRSALMQLHHSTWAVLECNASGFLLYKPRSKIDLEQLKALMNQALSLYQILREDESRELPK